METLDTFVGLITVFLVLSLIVSALGEGVSAWSNLKGRILKRSIERLLGDRMAEVFLEHPAIERLRPSAHGALPFTRARLPSYVPDTVFAEVLLDLCVNPPQEEEAEASARKPVTPNTLDRALRALRTDYADALLDMWQRAENDLEAMTGLITQWFNRTGDRSTGWFRRQLSLYLFGTGLVVAVALNADTIYMFQTLSGNASLRAELVGRATELVEEVRSTGLACEDAACVELATRFTAEPDDTLSPEQLAQLAGLCGQSAESLDRAACAADLEEKLDLQRRACQALGAEGECTMGDLIGAALPEVTPLLGPDLLAAQYAKRDTPLHFWPLKLLGWLLTAAAVSLGAPFWFDLLQKIVQIRSSIRPEVSPAPKPRAETAAPVVAEAPRARALIRAESAEAGALEGLAQFESKVFGFSPVNLFWSARFSKLAYVSEAQLVDAELDAWGAEGRLLSGGETQCVVAWTPRAAFVSFRGTERKLEDWLTNIDIEPVVPPWDHEAGFKVHTGFANALNPVWIQLINTLRDADVFSRNLPIWLSGHSLGGALAALASLRLTKELKEGRFDSVIGAVHTFGQPRVGDSACADALERTLPLRYFRSINQRDAVPRVPLPKTPDLIAKVENLEDPLPLYPYAHAGRVIYFTDAGRAMMDPPLWYRKLDSLAVALERDALVDALKQTVGDHDMGAYLHLHRDMVDVEVVVASGAAA